MTPTREALWEHQASSLLEMIRNDPLKSALQKREELTDQAIRFENTFGVDSRSTELAMDQLIEYELAYADEISEEAARLQAARRRKWARRNRKLQRWAAKIIPKKAKTTL